MQIHVSDRGEGHARMSKRGERRIVCKCAPSMAKLSKRHGNVSERNELYGDPSPLLWRSAMGIVALVEMTMCLILHGIVTDRIEVM